MRTATAAGLLGFCVTAACFTSIQEGAGQGSNVLSGGAAAGGTRRGGVGGGSSGAASTGATQAGTGTGSSSGSSGGATTGGATGGASSGSGGGTTAAFTISDGGLDAGIDCPDVYLASTIVDIETRQPIAGATISAVQLDGVPVPGGSASTAADGTFTVCVPSGLTFSLEITATGYPGSALEDTQLSRSEKVVFFNNGIPLLTQETMDVLVSLVPNGYDTSKGGVLVSINSLSGLAPCQDAAGWQFSVGLLDGGALPDGGYRMVYLDSDLLPDPTLQVTSANGNALFYDIDPNVVGRVAILAVDTNADAGACPIVNDQLGLQGSALMAPQTLTFGPMMVP